MRKREHPEAIRVYRQGEGRYKSDRKLDRASRVAIDGRSKFVLVDLHESVTLSPVSNMTLVASSKVLWP